MTTDLMTRPAPARTGIARPPLARLTFVELRKMTDTRAGRWLLAVTALLTVGAAILGVLALQDADRTLLNIYALALLPASILLPVVGILLVTSEWSQRTAMVTFTLVPRRQRVLGAKLLAGTALAVIAYLVALAVAVAVAAIWGVDLSMRAGMYGQAALSVVIAMLGGLAFGAAILGSAPAIVLYFVLPTAWGALGSIHALTPAARWLDPARTTSALLDHVMNGTEWSRLAVSQALWLLVPLAVGAWRIARSDPR